MAINFTDFSQAKIQDSPWADVFENALKGYKIGQEPAAMARKADEEKLANSIKELTLKHMPEEWALKKRLTEAQINKAERPAALKGALANAQAIRSQYPEGSREWSEANDYIKKLNTPKDGINISNSPDGGFEVSIGGSGEKGTIPGVGKLKPGETVVFDEAKKPIGVNTRLTAPELSQAQAKEQFNTIYPFANKALSYYSGQGSWSKFKNDIDNYSTDAAAKERVDNFNAAKNLLSLSTVTENARIGGHATNQQLKMLRKSLESSEVPKALVSYKDFKLPQGYAEISGKIMNDALNTAAEAAENNVPLWRFRALNPKKTKEFERAESSLKDKLNQHKPDQHDLVYNPATGRLE